MKTNIIKARLLLFFFYVLLLAGNAVGVPYQTETIFQDEQQSIVWGFDFISKDKLLISLKDGRLLIYNLKTKERKSVDIPKVTRIGQGGLLDVLYHSPTRYVFITFSEKLGENIVTSLARGTYRDQSIQNMKTIFKSKLVGNGGRHFGSRLVIKDEHIYMTLGDRGERDNSQILSNHNGTILKLTFDGKPSKDNPFINSANALPEIFSYGHRNPQGIDIHPITGEIFSCEFGPRGGDELNLVQAGKNYGWPIITYGKEYWGPRIGPTHKEGMEQPIAYWVPSISPSGMVFYRGDKLKKWKGNLFLANLATLHLRRLVLKENKVVKQEALFENLNERIRQVRNAPDGFLYFSTDSGKIVRIFE